MNKNRKENVIKYGDKSNDIITQSLLSSEDFVIFSILKYQTRLNNVAKLPFKKRWYYKLFLAKGGKRDREKVLDFSNRLKEHRETKNMR